MNLKPLCTLNPRSLNQRRTVVTFEIGGRIFGYFPVGNTADPAGPSKPFISEPAGRPAVSGIGNQKYPVAMGCNPGLIADDINSLDSMQQPPTRGPELNFLNQPKKLNPFPIVALAWRFNFCLFSHNTKFPCVELRLPGTVKRLNVEHRTSNIERRILMTLRFIYLKTSESR